MGTNELKEVLVFGFSVVRLVEGLGNGIGLGDLGNVISVVKSAPPAIKDAHLAFAEYVDLTDAEASEVESFIVSEFGVNPNVIESAIEKALSLIVSLRTLVSFFTPKA